jgi:hypothetical protein
MHVATSPMTTPKYAAQVRAATAAAMPTLRRSNSGASGATSAASPSASRAGPESSPRAYQARPFPWARAFLAASPSPQTHCRLRAHSWLRAGGSSHCDRGHPGSIEKRAGNALSPFLAQLSDLTE